MLCPVRILKLHPLPAFGDAEPPACDASCIHIASDIVFDEMGVCVSNCAPVTCAALPDVLHAEPVVSTPRRATMTCITADSPFQDPSIAVSYSASTGISCSLSQFAASVLAIASLQVRPRAPADTPCFHTLFLCIAVFAAFSQQTRYATFNFNSYNHPHLLSAVLLPRASCRLQFCLNAQQTKQSRLLRSPKHKLSLYTSGSVQMCATVGF